MIKAKQSKFQILLVEDEPNLAFNLKLNLEAEGYVVEHAEDGESAIRCFDARPSDIDLVILDIMIPEPDGLQVARHIRSIDKAKALIMLTARATDGDRIKGLEIGADDYINKPFHLQELLLRVRRSLERSRLFSPGSSVSRRVVKAGPFSLDTESLELSGPQGQFTLTALEADVLEEFMTNPNRVLSREHLLEKVWHLNGDVETRTVDNFIVRIRRYIEADTTNPTTIESVRGRGYRFRVPLTAE